MAELLGTVLKQMDTDYQKMSDSNGRWVHVLWRS